MDCTLARTGTSPKRTVYTLQNRIPVLCGDKGDGASVEAAWRRPQVTIVTLILLLNWTIDIYNERRSFKLIYCLLNVWTTLRGF